MKRCVDHLLNCPHPTVIASVTEWDAWRVLALGAKLDGSDWLELRLDMMADVDIEGGADLAHPALPLLVTMRRMEEGGHRVCADEDRMKILKSWLPPASAIDVEIASLDVAESLIAEAKRSGVRVIASSHDFSGVPSLDEMLELELEARQKGADIVKFAFTLKRPEDLLLGCQLLEQRSGDMAVMGMGDLGPCSRLLYSQLGSCLLYGFYGNVPSAPGQWPASEFKRVVGMLPLVNL